MDTLELMRGMLGSNGPGLEIGPLHRPVAPKRRGFDVDILDHASRADLQRKYGKDPNVDVSVIEDVDYVSDGRSMTDVISKPGHYDWIIASHVIEHSPDLLGFLLDCESMLKPKGKLVLAVPHRRFCFDATRPLASTGQVLDAHRARRTRHTFGTMFDYWSEFSSYGGLTAWSEGQVGSLVRTYSDRYAWEEAKATAEATIYCDAHAWVFMPASFRLIVETLHGLGLLGLREESYHPTVGCEFFVTLSRDGSGPGLSTDGLRRLCEEEQLAAMLDRFGLLPTRPRLLGGDAADLNAPGSLVADDLRLVYRSKDADLAAIRALQGLLDVREQESKRLDAGKLPLGTLSS